MGDFQVDGPTPSPGGYSVDKPTVSPGYFGAMGIRLLRGRDFTARDDGKAAGVVIVSEAVVRRELDPLQRRLGPGPELMATRSRSYTPVALGRDFLVRDALRDQLQQALGADYEIERELEGGAMSRVFLAREVTLDRQVVIKALPPELAVEISADRFRHEMAVLAQLSHPHIIPILRAGGGVGSDEATTPTPLHYVMPHQRGQSLRALLTRESRLPESQAISLAQEVAGALDYAHRYGVVHRDIKPENVLLADGHAMLIDFGVSRAVSTAGATSITRTGITVGTPAYMSPEQASGEETLDARSDIYSLGCVLYEMLTGRLPHAGATAPQLLARRITEPPPDIRALIPTASPALAELVRRSLAVDPAERFATGAEMAAALAAVAQGSGAARARRPRRIRRSTVAVVGVGAVLAGAAVMARMASEPRPALRVVVLPLTNLGRPDDAWFVDGLSDELRGALASMPNALVIHSRSSTQYKNTAKSFREIARELNVDYILTGTVSWDAAHASPGRIRVSPELVDVHTDGTRWRHSYDTTLSDLFAGQRAVAVRAAQDVWREVTGGDMSVPAKVSRPGGSGADPRSYEQYLRGRAEYYTWTGASMRRAIESFRLAVERDSLFADGWAWLAIASAAMQRFHTTSSVPSDTTTMRLAIARARAIDSTAANVRIATGTAYFFYDLDWDGTEREFRSAMRAVEDPTLFWFYCRLERARGRLSRALELARRAAEHDPLFIGDLYAQQLMWVGKLDEAIAEARAGLRRDSTSTSNNYDGYLGQALVLRGDYDDAITWLLRSERVRQRPNQHYRAVAHFKAGRQSIAQGLLDSVLANARAGAALPTSPAIVYANTGQPDSAIAWLERGYASGQLDDGIVNNMWYAPLRARPAFRALVRRMGL